MKILITGAEGFVGSNLSSSLALEGHEIVGMDNGMARKGPPRPPGGLGAIHWADCTSSDLAPLLEGVRAVIHCAGQTAVTRSLLDPAHDFRANVVGTVRLLEAVRRLPRPRPLVIFMSTNKVYGTLGRIKLHRVDLRSAPVDRAHEEGVGESHPLDFVTPYACSKGAADQYVREYGRSCDIPTLVLRCSCLAGAGQKGTIDHGWVSHIAHQALYGLPVTVCGEGTQVRDVLAIQDFASLISRLVALHEADPEIFKGGWVFNVGGGPRNSISVLELIAKLKVPAKLVSHGPARSGDQEWYVTNNSAIRKFLDHEWSPSRSLVDILNDILLGDGR